MLTIVEKKTSQRNEIIDNNKGLSMHWISFNAAVTFKSYSKNLIRLDFSLFCMRRDHDHTATLI